MLNKIYMLAGKSIKYLGLFLVFLLILPIGILIFFISEIWFLTDRLADWFQRKGEKTTQDHIKINQNRELY